MAEFHRKVHLIYLISFGTNLIDKCGKISWNNTFDKVDIIWIGKCGKISWNSTLDILGIFWDKFDR